MNKLSTVSTIGFTKEVKSQKERTENTAQQQTTNLTKKALLVVSFGTSFNQSREKNIGAIEKELSSAFPNYDLKRAFTSQIIINKLATRDGLVIDNVKQAMDKLVEEGYSTILCQPTHVMNGNEYDEIVNEILPYSSKFTELIIGKPLLSSKEDYSSLVHALMASLPPLASNELLVLMGHGTAHHAEPAYSSLSYHFQNEGISNILVGTIEGYPDFDTVLKEIKKRTPSTVYITPLMVVAGKHAIKDMASDSEVSWKTKLKIEGYEVKSILKGLGEYPAIRKLYVSHAKQAVNKI